MPLKEKQVYKTLSICVELIKSGVNLKLRLKYPLTLSEAVLTCNQHLCFEQKQNKKNITPFHMQIIFFTTVKNCSILYGNVFIM